MVNKSPWLGLWDPFQMAFLWLINGGDPNHLLTGMILQVVNDTPPKTNGGSAGSPEHIFL